jgi:cytochrome c oxidase assembly protein subunit 19
LKAKATPKPPTIHWQEFAIKKSYPERQMADAFGASRIKVQPPERGVFPLDHEHECKTVMKKFLTCLKENGGDHFPCKNDSEMYLQCRMDRGLMAKDDLSKLGFGKDAS